jgi:hypothetical protein
MFNQITLPSSKITYFVVARSAQLTAKAVIAMSVYGTCEEAIQTMTRDGGRQLCFRTHHLKEWIATPLATLAARNDGGGLNV